VGAGVLAISQFTLFADTRKGRRPTWGAAAPGPVAEPLYDAFCAAIEERGVTVARGVFGADMAVELVNDGPVTSLMDSRSDSWAGLSETPVILGRFHNDRRAPGERRPRTDPEARIACVEPSFLPPAPPDDRVGRRAGRAAARRGRRDVRVEPQAQ